jgi:hypothetical protein
MNIRSETLKQTQQHSWYAMEGTAAAALAVDPAQGLASSDVDERRLAAIIAIGAVVPIVNVEVTKAFARRARN